jgi:hypothetical protein
MSIPLLTKQQFKETSRYLQEQLSSELGEKIKLSTAHEALSRTMGFNNYHAYQHFIDTIKKLPTKAKWANGDISVEITSLNFCMEAAKGCSGTQNRIRAILIHLYNNCNPVKIDLKNFDEEHKIHILNVLALDARPHKEIHNYIENGNNIFSKWVNEAHLDREWNKYRDDVYRFCEVAERLHGVTDYKTLESTLLKEWIYHTGNLKEHKITPIDVEVDGKYNVCLDAVDEFDYDYSVVVTFNKIKNLLYICEESLVNEEAESGLISSVVDQKYISEYKEYSAGDCFESRSYFKL